MLLAAHHHRIVVVHSSLLPSHRCHPIVDVILEDVNIDFVVVVVVVNLVGSKGIISPHCIHVAWVAYVVISFYHWHPISMYIAGGSEVLDQLQSHSKVREGAQKKGVCIGFSKRVVLIRSPTMLIAKSINTTWLPGSLKSQSSPPSCISAWYAAQSCASMIHHCHWRCCRRCCRRHRHHCLSLSCFSCSLAVNPRNLTKASQGGIAHGMGMERLPLDLP